MKRMFKYATGLLLTGALTLMLVVNADAQRGGVHAGGGGGGGVSAGGGGGGGGGSFSRGGVGGFNGNSYRPSYNYRPTYGYRSGVRYGLGFGFGYPSLGLFYNSLPFGYYPFYWGSSLYYYNDGIFYNPYGDGDGYIVAAPPVGAAVPKLPKAAKAIMIDNQQFYEYNGVYYKTIVNDKGDTVFVVAGKDGVLNTDGSDGDSAASATVMPKVGDMVDQLPDSSRRITLNGKNYFVSGDDIYYEVVTDRNGRRAYRIASVPDGN